MALDLIVFGSRLTGMKRVGEQEEEEEEGRRDVRLPPPSELSGCVEELIAGDQPKWTPAPRRAPVSLRRSEQSEHAANKWMHFLCPRLRLGSLRLPHYSHYSAACGLSNAPPLAPPLTGLCFGRGLDSFFQGHFINNPVWPGPRGDGGGGEGAELMQQQNLQPPRPCGRSLSLQIQNSSSFSLSLSLSTSCTHMLGVEVNYLNIRRSVAGAGEEASHLQPAKIASLVADEGCLR